MLSGSRKCLHSSLDPGPNAPFFFFCQGSLTVLTEKRVKSIWAQHNYPIILAALETESDLGGPGTRETPRPLRGPWQHCSSTVESV